MSLFFIKIKSPNLWANPYVSTCFNFPATGHLQVAVDNTMYKISTVNCVACSAVKSWRSWADHVNLSRTPNDCASRLSAQFQGITLWIAPGARSPNGWNRFDATSPGCWVKDKWAASPKCPASKMPCKGPAVGVFGLRVCPIPWHQWPKSRTWLLYGRSQT